MGRKNNELGIAVSPQRSLKLGSSKRRKNSQIIRIWLKKMAIKGISASILGFPD